LLDLKVDYNRLFVGPAAPLCPPYQSVYDRTRPTVDQGMVLGPTAEAVAEAMRQEGLGVILDHAELPDHAAIILEFMYYLLSRARDAENGPEYASRADQFRSQHIAPWLAEFGASVAKNAKHPFYAHAGRLLAQFVSSEAR
jgi:TorA maturation chaperone TorD